MVQSIRYYLVSAFSADKFGGNPTAIVFLEDENKISPETLGKIATNFNQPMTAAVWPERPSDKPKVAKFPIRWFTSYGSEIKLCGHATVAASKLIFDRFESEGRDVQILEFETQTSGTLIAQKTEDGRIQLAMQAVVPVEFIGEERQRLVELLNKAVDREVKVHAVVAGDHFLLYEIDSSEDLKGSKIDHEPLKLTGYVINTITTDSVSGDETFVCRTFLPTVLASGEDPVCGSSHCLTAPYWYKKKGIKTGNKALSTVVSPRGGSVGVVWEQDNAIKLSGTAVVFANGDFLLE